MNDIFYSINDTNKKKLLKILETNIFCYKKNISIISNNRKENNIGIILDGWAQIIRTDYDGNKTLIEDLTTNSIFGTVISSLSNKEYDVITKEDTKILVINYNKIITSDENNNYFNQFMKNLLQIIANKMIEKNERINILTKKTTRDKLLEYFNIISKKQGGKILYLPFSLSDLACYLSVDRSAMMREIKNLKEDKMIESSNSKIKLLY